MTFTLDLDIAAEPAAVFGFVADFANTPLWYSAVQRVERLHGAGGLGTEYAVHRRLPGGAVVNRVVVTSYVDGREITLTSVSGPTPFTYRYSVESAPKGVRLLLEGTISAAGLSGPGRLLGPVAERLFKRGMRDNLRILKDIIPPRSGHVATLPIE
ncbi:SRPBCC family protein [Leifsonia sp. NPDC058230]|uniref:SRPBCC family protein n=1 Tax=Leifsonia sp. NPDC058230 TaxID=3346391 RepID=UPI0036DD9C29